MSIAPLNSAASLNPLAAAQQASAVGADDFAPEDAGASGLQSTASATASNLTGSSTGALSSQTLQALMNLTQADPQSQAQGAQKAHRHHHGGGGGSQSLSQIIQTQSMTSADPSIAELDSSDAGDAGDGDSDSLATALGL